MHLPKSVSPVSLSTPILHKAHLRPHSRAWVPAPDWKQGLQPWVLLLQIIEPAKLESKLLQKYQDSDFWKPPIAVPVAVVSVAALIRGSQVKPWHQDATPATTPAFYWPWIIGNELPSLVVHVGKAVVEVRTEVCVNIVNVKLSWDDLALKKQLKRN